MIDTVHAGQRLRITSPANPGEYVIARILEVVMAELITTAHPPVGETDAIVEWMRQASIRYSVVAHIEGNLETQTFTLEAMPDGKFRQRETYLLYDAELLPDERPKERVQ